MRPLPLIRRIALVATFSAVVGSARAASPCSNFADFPHDHACFAGRFTLGTLLSAVIGEPPSTLYPHGTVILAWSVVDLGVAVTEWDLAGARRVRQTSLGLPQSDVFAIRFADRVSVLSTSMGKLTWTLVDAHRLQVVRQVTVARDASLARVASDDALTAIVWKYQPWFPSQRAPDETFWRVATYDAKGHLLGSWAPGGEQSDRSPGLAVLNGAAYVTTHGKHAQLFKLSPDATPVAQMAMGALLGSVSMLARDGKLLVASPTDLVEISPDLRVLSRQPMGEDLSMFAIADDGRVLNGQGKIFSPSLRAQARMMALSWPQSVLWLGRAPVTVTQYPEPYHVVLITWRDPDSLPPP